MGQKLTFIASTVFVRFVPLADVPTEVSQTGSMLRTP